MTAKTIPGNEFFKSLGRLEALAGGESVEKAQLFHTGKDSEPGNWPGGEKTEIGNNWSDSIGADGTDYHPARKSIAEKALKGIPLSPEEIAILKSDIECRKSEDDDKDENPFGKSFEMAAGQSESIQKGLEISEFLTDLVKAFGAGLGGIEARTTSVVEDATNAMLSRLGGYLDERFTEQQHFNKSLAEAVVNIGHGLAGNIAQLDAVAQAPVGAPKSQLRAVNVVEKSFGGPAGEGITKSQKLDAMVDMVEKGKINSLEVCKFETTGQLRPDLDAMIVGHIQAAGGKR